MEFPEFINNKGRKCLMIWENFIYWFIREYFSLFTVPCLPKINIPPSNFLGWSTVSVNFFNKQKDFQNFLSLRKHFYFIVTLFNNYRLLVGAPLDKNLQPNTSRSGALWKCPLTTRHDDCEQVITDGQRSKFWNKLKRVQGVSPFFFTWGCE